MARPVRTTNSCTSDLMVGTETNSSGEPILLLEDACRTYGRGAQLVRALGPVHLVVRTGEFIAVMGPSGSGKTTLLALAGALDRPTSGRVLLRGQDLAKMTGQALSAVRRRVVGYVFQEFNLLPGLTVVENVALPLELDGMPLGEAKEAAHVELDRVGLSALAGRFPDDISGGEQQRVAIARSFVGPREVLLADEPTGALDSLTGELVMQQLRAECDRGRTAVVVTHNSAHAAWADRVIYLRDGVICDEVVANTKCASTPVLQAE